MTDKTFEALLNEALDKIDPSLDKREGSIIYNALAPTCLELAQCYDALENYQKLFFPDTSCGEYLDRVVGQFGVTRSPAQAALRKGTFIFEEGMETELLPGSRFACGELVFVLQEKLEDGVYSLECESAGEVGNGANGELFALEVVAGLTRASLGEILRPGTEQEDDDSLRERFYQQVRSPAFGGNRADYEQKALSLEGIGAVKVFGASEVGAGQVKLIVGGEDARGVDEELVQQIQQQFGPDADGNGLAPLCHTVTVESCIDLPVDISATLVTEPGSDKSLLIQKVKAGLKSFLISVPFERATVFLAQVTAKILETQGVLDVSGLTLNGQAQNLILQKKASAYEVPVAGSITIS